MMKSPLIRAAKVVASLMVIIICFFAGCVNKKSKSNTELRSVTVRKPSAESLDLPILKSFGFIAKVNQTDLTVPLPEGSGNSALALGCLNIQVDGRFQTDAKNLLPLYSSAMQSQTRFVGSNLSFELKDFLSPALQAGLNHEFRFESSEHQLSSTDALLAMLLSDGRTIQFTAHPEGDLHGLFLSGISFRSVGDFLSSVKPAQASRRERNSGFAVGDLLIISENGVLKHSALWLDHDIYYEALPFGRSILFRMASYGQLLEELSLRSNSDVRSLKFTAVRRVSSWSEMTNRLKSIKGQAAVGRANIGLDSRGRGVVTSTSALRVISRLRQSTGGDGSLQDNQR